MISSEEKRNSFFVRIIFIILAVLSALGAFLVRFVQLYRLTDGTSGRITIGHTTSIIVLYVFVLVFIVSICCLTAFSECRNPFYSTRFKALPFISILTAVAFFYDFVKQCLSCYQEITNNDGLQTVYIVFIGINAVFALFSSFYFFTISVSLNNPNYNFKTLGFVHLAPFLWAFSRLIFCFSLIVYPVYSVEDILSFALIIVFTLFFLRFAMLTDLKKEKSQHTARLGLVGSFLALIISLPRIIIFFFDTDMSSTYYSSLVYFVIGVFILSFSLNIMYTDRKV